MLRLRYIIILLCIFSLQYLYGQANLSLIQGKYEELDSVQYLKGLDEAIFQSVVRDFGEPLENHIKQRTNSIRNGVSGQTIRFVLNVDIDTTKLDSDIYDYLKIDTSRNNFNVYCFDKNYKPVYFIFFHEGKLEFYGDFFPTFSKRYSKKVRSALRGVLKKKPLYLLYCDSMPNMILYVKDGKIFVHRVLQNKVYKLNDYVAKRKDSKRFNCIDSF